MRMCCGCGTAPAMRQERSSYCLPCHAQKTREWRQRHPYATLPALSRFKSTMRAYANVYAKRGKIEKCDCYMCGATEAEKHHPDYSQPLMIVWLCRKCHLDAHTHEMPHDDSLVERLALQWDEKRKRGVKVRQGDLLRHGRATVPTFPIAQTADPAAIIAILPKKAGHRCASGLTNSLEPLRLAARLK